MFLTLNQDHYNTENIDNSNFIHHETCLIWKYMLSAGNLNIRYGSACSEGIQSKEPVLTGDSKLCGQASLP